LVVFAADAGTFPRHGASPRRPTMLNYETIDAHLAPLIRDAQSDRRWIADLLCRKGSSESQADLVDLCRRAARRWLTLLEHIGDAGDEGA
jgi:hypothetical protein